MQIRKIKTVKEYVDFIKKLYRDDKFYKDNKSDIIRMICNPSSSFFKNSIQEKIGVISEGRLKCQTILINHKNLKDTLMLAFFDSEKDAKKEVQYLLDYCKKRALDLECRKILIAINGHCNYGLGILSNSFNNSPSFAEAYNYDYYKDYFEKDFFIRKFHSYKNTLESAGNKVIKFKERFIDQNIRFVHYDALSKDFDFAVKIYTNLNNIIFKNHFYYYQREYEEDKELFYSMKPLLLNKNLIIAYKGDKPIGFLLWYPDFNELVNVQHSVNIRTVLKYIVLKQKPKQIMLTEIGVLPEYENNGLILALFLETYKYLNERYNKNINVCSGWIADENLKSKKLVKHVLDKTDKEFCVYELII